MKKIILSLAVITLAAAYGCANQSKPKTAGSVGVKGLKSVYFDYDSTEIKSEYKSALKSNAETLKGDSGKVTIVGHCDERGSDEYNMALGQRRAASVKSYLTSLGVSASNVATKSFGEEKPAKSCHEESCWSENRRAEFTK